VGFVDSIRPDSSRKLSGDAKLHKKIGTVWRVESAPRMCELSGVGPGWKVS